MCPRRSAGSRPGVITAGPSGSDEAAGRAADAFAALVGRGWALPLPGAGATGQRWSGLGDLGAQDLPVARLAEGHADARAILAELGRPRSRRRGRRLGVWAAEPPTARLGARRAAGGVAAGRTQGLVLGGAHAHPTRWSRRRPTTAGGCSSPT